MLRQKGERPCNIANVGSWQYCMRRYKNPVSHSKEKQQNYHFCMPIFAVFKIDSGVIRTQLLKKNSCKSSDPKNSRN